MDVDAARFRAPFQQPRFRNRSRARDDDAGHRRAVLSSTWRPLASAGGPPDRTKLMEVMTRYGLVPAAPKQALRVANGQTVS